MKEVFQLTGQWHFYQDEDKNQPRCRIVMMPEGTFAPERWQPEPWHPPPQDRLGAWVSLDGPRITLALAREVVRRHLEPSWHLHKIGTVNAPAWEIRRLSAGEVTTMARAYSPGNAQAILDLLRDLEKGTAP